MELDFEKKCFNFLGYYILIRDKSITKFYYVIIHTKITTKGKKWECVNEKDLGVFKATNDNYELTIEFKHSLVIEVKKN